MTRAELHNIPGFHASSLLAAAAHLRAELKPKKTAFEPTALIASGCETNGYLKAIEDLLAAATLQPEKTPPKTHQPYSQPQTENQNKP